ncbi:asparaginase [Chondrinema litorale]|uniref:asparaginase n=1 Tax=Chondrinema litorale TaxID=2994555 RepID=UPI0025429D8B|nr:asparaginase [Chondrinema litorale]UZR93442.1 asparaginase [Chondrinema litorale]
MTRYYKTVNINTAIQKGLRGSVLVIYTGGTIGMDYDEQTGSLIPFDFEKVIEKVPELKRFEFQLTVLSFSKLIDSSDININHWLELSRIIYDFYDDYDGFIILHGTDTMAYSASALSFLLQNLSKPVIFTGAQLPIGASRTDARDNLVTALEIASAKHEGKALIPEVCIYFDHLLLRGNRAKKVQNFNFTAFESANYPALAVAGIHIEYNLALIKEQADQPLKIYNKMDNNIAVLKIFPGITYNMMKPLLDNPNIKGVILETFGSGNAPTSSWFLNLISETIEKGIHVLNVSQCSGGSVAQGKYITSKYLEDLGVIGAADMTFEAAITKMMFVLGNNTDNDVIKELLVNPMVGECS